MKRKIIIPVLLLIPFVALAQFEQRASVNLAGGIFKTIGTKDYYPDWATEGDEREPFQMSNYKPGFSGMLSFQFNLNRRISLTADLGYSTTSKWEYIAYEDVNYLWWEIYDTVQELTIREGSNELTLVNASFGLGIKYYFRPDKDFKPYLSANVNMNMTRADFTDTYWLARRDLGMLEPDDSGPDQPYLEESTGFGLTPAVGVEYTLNDRLGFFIHAEYSFVQLDKSKFKTTDQEENLNMIRVMAGLRFSFWKSKEF
jgi:opacity protein-like surface antigen